MSTCLEVILHKTKWPKWDHPNSMNKAIEVHFLFLLFCWKFWLLLVCSFLYIVYCLFLIVTFFLLVTFCFVLICCYCLLLLLLDFVIHLLTANKVVWIHTKFITEATDRLKRIFLKTGQTSNFLLLKYK